MSEAAGLDTTSAPLCSGWSKLGEQKQGFVHEWPASTKKMMRIHRASAERWQNKNGYFALTSTEEGIPSLQSIGTEQALMVVDQAESVGWPLAGKGYSNRVCGRRAETAVSSRY
jgi:hypothetical protein